MLLALIVLLQLFAGADCAAAGADCAAVGAAGAAVGAAGAALLRFAMAAAYPPLDCALCADASFSVVVCGGCLQLQVV